ncbi:MAG: 16S rRNA (guanine(966)-N(2))-methyltransferase RsmD, partial [Candidatus Poribacteria bacterium]
MRIIGGKCGGKLLKVPKGLAVRPTPDLVRQAIFNSLGARVVDAVVLELFGGTGALSLECLSRGAKNAICVELSPRHSKIIKENFSSMGLPKDVFKVITHDVYSILPTFSSEGLTFDIIFADPPFGEKTKGERSHSHSQKLLDNPYLPKLLKPDGLFCLGHTKRDAVEVTTMWTEVKSLR